MSAENTFHTEDQLSERTRYRDLVVRIWPYVKRHRGLLSIVATLVVLHTAISRVLPNLIGYVVDHMIVPKKLDLLLPVCLIYFALEIVKFVFVCAETYLFQVLGQKVIFDLRSDLFRHVLALPIRFFDTNPVGRLVTRMTNDFGSLADLFTAGLVTVFTDLLSLFAITIAMLLISVKLTLIVMAVSPLMLFASLHLSRRARETLRKMKKRLAMINSFVAENISGMKVIQLYVREKRQNERFSQMSNDYRDVQMDNIRYLAWLYPTVSAFNAITVAFALYYGGYLNHQSSLAVGALVAFLMHVQDFLPPMRNILEKYQTFQASLASAERIFTLFDAHEETLQGRPLPSTKVMGHIEFRNVSFGYSKEVGPVIRGISFEIQPGQSVAIVGATGSGKSTIVNLLQRFYEIDSKIGGSGGSVLLDGVDIMSLDKRELRRKIGVVHQDFFLFQGTIASNINLDDPVVPNERIREAALKANCEELLKAHAGGLDAPVVERGNNLSAGEKQLVSFARVLAFNPDVLILDEATAHIDSHSEALIQQATREVTRNRTSIIIAHRLSTILECDRILVMDHGTLVEQGSHAELLRAGGVYQKLYQLQLSKQAQQ